MDLDNINDVEVLRKAAKSGRTKLKKDVVSNNGDYIFKKGFWYYVEQDDYEVSIVSDDFIYSASLTYEEAFEYLDRD